jgi:GT2 family glycosyltransferase
MTNWIVVDKSTSPPGGWQWRENATGWRIQNPMELDFRLACIAIQTHRKANPGYQLSTDPNDIAQELENFTAFRLNQDARFVRPISDGQKKTTLFNRVVQAAGAAVSRIKADAAAVATLLELVGDGGDPVSFEEAETRASICVRCPQNVGRYTWETTAAGIIAEQLRVKKIIGAHTSLDPQLKSCGACGCKLELKVQVPLEHIRKHQPRDVKLPRHCWIVDQPISRPVIRIRREAAFGDVIQASVFATKFYNLGYDVHFRCNDTTREALRCHPHIASFILDPNAPVDVDLDATYELSPDFKTKHMAELYQIPASAQLAAKGFKQVSPSNRVPVLAVTEDEKAAVRQRIGNKPHPWVTVIPRSGAWVNRTLSQEDLAGASRQISGTCIWGSDIAVPPNSNFTNPAIRDFRQLMALIAISDVVLTPDTGPMHVAAAMNVPLAVVQQCMDIGKRLTDQTDYVTIESGLDCLRCMDYSCRINPENPPCQRIDPALVASVVNSVANRSGVSAVIPVYKYHPRLMRCIEAIRSQVKEVIVVLDADAQAPAEIPGVRVIPSTGKRIGYGKTVMRGCRVASGEWLLMLNDDCYLDQGAVGQMLSVATDKVAVVGAQLRHQNGTIQHAGTFRVANSAGFGHLDYGQPRAQIQTPREMEFVTFAAALVRRKAFYQVRGFDEAFDCYGEDADLCMSLRKAGWRVMYQPHATGIHDESQSTSEMKMKLLDAGNQVFAAKWKEYFHRNPVNVLGTFE